MSKHLVKIISICALAILLPLTIVAVALCVTEPVACTLTIAEGGKNGQYATSDISIRVEGKDVEGETIKVKKHSEVTVVFEGEGYNFKGWFNGKADEIQADDEAVSFDSAYKFTLRGNTTLTAVRDVIEYTVKYSGFLDDGVTEVGTQIEETTQTVEYGETLASLTSIEGAEWGGWYVVSSQGESVDATGVRVANFDTTEVELKPVWSNQMTITYMKGETKIAQQRISQEAASTHTFINGESAEVKAALTAGKEFAGWVDINGNPVTSIVYDLNGLTVYLKENTITYTLNVKYNAVSDNSTTITYDVDNGFSTLAYEVEDYRVFYTFKGLEFNGVLYSKSGADYVSENSVELSDKIIENAQTSVTVVAVWECYYSPIMLNIEGVSYYEDAEYGFANWAVYGTKDGFDNIQLKEEGFSINFEDKAESDYYDLEDDVYELFIKPYTNIHTGDNVATTFAYEATIYVDGANVGYDISFSDEHPLKFKNVMASVEEEFGLEGVESLTIQFKFNKVVA